MFEIFNTFSKDEKTFFEDFLNTKFFNGSKILVQLYKFVIDKYDNPEELLLEGIKSSRNIFKKNYSEKIIKEYCYKLNNKAKEFLSLNRFILNDFRKDEYALTELSDRYQEKSFLKLHKKMSDELSKEFDSTQKFYKLYLLEEKYINFMIKDNHIIKHSKIKDLLLRIKRCSQFKSIYLFMEQISLFTSYKINSFSSGDDNLEDLFKNNFIETLYNNIENRESFPLVELYYKLFIIFSDINDISRYHEYKHYLIDNLKNIHPEEIKHHFQSLINYCTVKKIVTNNTFFDDELLELYKTYLDSKLYEFEGEKFIETRVILNIIKRFKVSGNMDWILNYIETNLDSLKPKDRINIKHFLHAYYFFNEKNYAEAMSKINKIKIDQFSYKFDIQTLKIRILYELEDENIESSLSLIDSFKITIKKDNFLPSSTKQKTLKFLYFLEKLIIKSDNKNIIKYNYHLLKKESQINFKKWLLSKYEEKLR